MPRNPEFDFEDDIPTVLPAKPARSKRQKGWPIWVHVLTVILTLAAILWAAHDWLNLTTILSRSSNDSSDDGEVAVSIMRAYQGGVMYYDAGGQMQAENGGARLLVVFAVKNLTQNKKVDFTFWII